jgi:hypothetical protein
MTSHSRAVLREFALAAIAIGVAFATGVAWIGKPLRLVELVTLLGLGMTAGATWAQAIWRARQTPPV